MQWFQKDKRKRLENDKQIVTSCFPKLLYHEDTKIYIVGDIELLSDSGISTLIRIRIDFPDNYPIQEPIVKDISGRFDHVPDRHFYRDGRCCLWLPPVSQWKSNKLYALRDFIDEVIVFFDKQLLYDITGRWPGPAWAHGAQGYLEYIQSILKVNKDQLVLLVPAIINLESVSINTPCPCGSKKKFKNCHIYSIREIHGKIPKNQILEVLEHFKATRFRVKKWY